MVAILKKGASKSSIKKIMESLIEKKVIVGLDAHKFCGTISLKTDALKLQKEIRDEWQ